MISPKLKSFIALVTFNCTSNSCVPCGAMVNQGGFKLTVVPLGGNTAQRYVSGSFRTFLTVRCTDRDPINADIVIEGRFRLAG